VPATVSVDGDVLTVRLAEPQAGIAPGQAVVLYDRTRVVGSATIERTVRTGPRLVASDRRQLRGRAGVTVRRTG
jgi:tRNA-specific 2-thiouridylase